MSECETMQELLSAMLDGALSQADAARVESHIAHCDDCRAMYQAFAAVSAAVSAEEDVPADLHERIMSTVNTAARAAKTQKKLVQLRTVLSLAACLVVIVGTVFAVGRSGLLRMGRADSAKSTEVNTAALPQMSTYSVTAGSSGGTAVTYDAVPAEAPESVMAEVESANPAANDAADLTAPTLMDGCYYAAPATMLVQVTKYIEGNAFVGVLVECSQEYFPPEAQLVLLGADGSVCESLPEPGGMAQLEFDHWEETDQGYTVYFSYVKIYED